MPKSREKKLLIHIAKVVTQLIEKEGLHHKKLAQLLIKELFKPENDPFSIYRNDSKLNVAYAYLRQTSSSTSLKEIMQDFSVSEKEILAEYFWIRKMSSALGPFTAELLVNAVRKEEGGTIFPASKKITFPSVGRVFHYSSEMVIGKRRGVAPSQDEAGSFEHPR